MALPDTNVTKVLSLSLARALSLCSNCTNSGVIFYSADMSSYLATRYTREDAKKQYFSNSLRAFSSFIVTLKINYDNVKNEKL